jgi:predicted ATP-dependent endonuclease of OLD family
MVKLIEITNFRAFKYIKVDFEKFNSLVGENGAGKTTILDALNLVLSTRTGASSFDEQDFNAPELEEAIEITVEFSEPFNAVVKDGYHDREIPCDKVHLIAKRRNSASPGKAFSDECTVIHIAIPIDAVRKRTTKEGQLKYEVDRIGEESTPFQFYPNSLSLSNIELSNYLRVFYFDKKRENQTKTGFNTTFQRIVKEFNWRFRKYIEPNKNEYIESWNSHYEIILNTQKTGKLKSIIEKLQEQLSAFLDSDARALEISLTNLGNPFNNAFFSFRNGMTQIEQSRFGSGISIILSYLLLDAISGLSKEKLIILIDEPELHLHPQLQEKFRAHLQSSDNQVVISTHSERMVDISDWASIKRFSETHEIHPQKIILNQRLQCGKVEKTIAEHLEEISLYQQHVTIYTKENNELFFAKVVLLVEGPIEKHGLLLICKKHNISVESATIISCNGKSNILYYQLLCTTFGIPFFTLFDADEDDNETKDVQLNSDIITLAQYGHRAFRNNFESLYNVSKNNKHKASTTFKKISESQSLPDEITEFFKTYNSFCETIKPSVSEVPIEKPKKSKKKKRENASEESLFQTAEDP